MSIAAARGVWSEPAAPDATGPQTRDWALVAVVVVVACVETAARTDLVWRIPSLAVTLVGAAALPWRRTRAFAATALAVGTAIVVEVAALANDVTWDGLGTAVFFLVFPYSLGRWGSGRDLIGGLGFFATIIAITAVGGDPAGDVIGGSVVVLLAAAVGLWIRFQRLSAQEKLDSTRSRERVALARELHDTVAHHVSAIAVQAQAGRALGGSDDPAIAGILETIEEQASRALEEMRSMVGALREGDQLDLAPQQGIHDIERLAQLTGNGTGPAVTVELRGPLDDLRPSVDVALYRIAQEAITNARRHAVHATTVSVQVVGGDRSVELTVDDDGDLARPVTSPGFGVAGMAERTKLLDGTFSAGPRPDGGWNVTAVLPRHRPVG